jgi:hypothetical protein
MRIAAAFVLAGLVSTPLAAQDRRNNQGIPPGQMPPAGQCRVWYEGVPPGRQPRAMNCNEAERIASRSRNARVIYGNDRNNGWWNRDDRDRDRDRDRRDRDRGSVWYPNSTRFPDNRYPNSRGNYGYQSVAYDNGFNDGLAEGRKDGRDRNRFDPERESRYRSADHGYNSRYGSKDEYKNVYRDGFREGYDRGYRDMTYARR